MGKPKRTKPVEVPKRERFAREYVIDLNATQAAIRAGYAKGSAHVTGCELLKDPKVAASIATLQAQYAAKQGITAERVLAELAKIGFANMEDYLSTTSDGDPFLDFSALTREQTAALQEVTIDDYVDGRGRNARDVKRIKFRLCDKRAALVDLGRHLNLFAADNKRPVELTGPNGGPVQYAHVDQLTDEQLEALAIAGQPANARTGSTTPAKSTPGTKEP